MGESPYGVVLKIGYTPLAEFPWYNGGHALTHTGRQRDEAGTLPRPHRIYILYTPNGVEVGTRRNPSGRRYPRGTHSVPTPRNTRETRYPLGTHPKVYKLTRYPIGTHPKKYEGK